jgi:hypothetical protein
LEFPEGIEKPKDFTNLFMGYANHPKLGINNLMIIY